MATTSSAGLRQPSTTAAAGSFTTVLATALERAGAWLRARDARRARRAGMAELRVLDDHVLRDLGLHRDDLR